MVGGLGWLRRRVCTCRLGSPPPASYPLEDGFFSLSRFCIADHGPPKMPGAVQTCGIASSRRALSAYPIFIAPGFILFSESGLIRSAGFCWINLSYNLYNLQGWKLETTAWLARFSRRPGSGEARFWPGFPGFPGFWSWIPPGFSPGCRQSWIIIRESGVVSNPEQIVDPLSRKTSAR